jgi:hypothetical protein
MGNLVHKFKKLTFREVRWKTDWKTMFHWTTVGFLYGDRQKNTFSLCPVEAPRNLLVVRIRCVSGLRTHPHTYPRRFTSLDTYSDMYVEDEVLLYTMKCKTW